MLSLFFFQNLRNSFGNWETALCHRKIDLQFAWEKIEQPYQSKKKFFCYKSGLDTWVVGGLWWQTQTLHKSCFDLITRTLGILAPACTALKKLRFLHFCLKIDHKFMIFLMIMSYNTLSFKTLNDFGTGPDNPLCLIMLFLKPGFSFWVNLYLFTY